MARFPGTVIPSKIKKHHWTYTYREGDDVENVVLVTAEELDPTQVFERAPFAKTAMRAACGNKKKRFVGNAYGIPTYS